MLAFEGSPIRKLAPELDAAKVEEHEKLLNDSQYKHLCAIRECMKDLGHKLFEMTPEMFIEDIFECCRFMLDSPDWGDYCFNQDVFGTVWTENFGHRFPELTSVIPFSPAHISIVEHDDKRLRELADITAKLDAKKADSKKTLKVKKKEKSAKRKIQFDKAALARKKLNTVSFVEESESSDEGDDEVELKTNIVEMVPKKRKDPGPLYRGEHAITAASMAGIKQARIEADKAFEQAQVPGISDSKRRRLYLDGANLLQVVKKLEDVGANKPFGRTDSTCGNAAVVLSRLPAELKGAMDNDPANNNLTVIEFFDKLTDVLIPEKPNAKVPFLLACLKGRLLRKFKESCELAGGVHEVDYDSCRDWLEQELFDPDEVPRMYNKFRKLTQGSDDLDTFVTKVNDLRTLLGEHGQRPEHNEYKHQILDNLNPAIEALATQRPGFANMGLKKKLVALLACEKSIALSEKVHHKRARGQISVAASKKKLQARGRQGKLARLVVEKNSDDSDADSDDNTVEVGSFTQGELDREITRRAQSIASKTVAKLQSADGKTGKKLTQGQKKRKKAAAAAAAATKDGKWLDKSKVSPFAEETISGHIKFDVFADAYEKTADWSKKREAHDKLVQTGKKKASDAPELYKWDRWKGKFACLLCRKTGHTQNHERCPA